MGKALGLLPAAIAALLAVAARADSVRLTDGLSFEGDVVKTDTDTVDIRIKKDLVDPDDWHKVVRSTDAPFLVLQNGVVLRGVVASTAEDGLVMRLPRRSIAQIGPEAEPVAVAPADTAPSAPPSDVWKTEPRLDSEALSSTRLNEFSINLGGFVPLSRLTLQGTDAVAGYGAAFGAQYLRDVTSAAAVGVGIERLNGGSHNSDTLLANANTASQTESTVALLLGRYSINEGSFRLHVLGGVGIQETNLQINSAPQPGYTWTDTGTTETRTMVNSTQSTAALMLQPGFDAYLSDAVWVGAGLAYYYLGAATYDATPAAQKFGLSNVHGSLAGVQLTANLNLRF